MGKRGFTLIELITVLVIIGVLTLLGFPRLRDSLRKSNVRSAKVALVTLVAKARSVAVARGCRATLSFTAGTSGTVAISVCTVNGSGTETLGGVEALADRYKVAMVPSSPTFAFDPRGLSASLTGMSVVFASGTAVDTVVINPLGKVVRQ